MSLNTEIINMGKVEKSLLKRVLEEFTSNFTPEQKKQMEFSFKREDKNDRDIYICNLPTKEFGIFSPIIYSSCFLLKIKKYTDKNKMGKVNFDFSFELQTSTSLKLSFPFMFFVFDENTDILKEYKR